MHILYIIRVWNGTFLNYVANCINFFSFCPNIEMVDEVIPYNWKVCQIVYIQAHQYKTKLYCKQNNNRNFPVINYFINTIGQKGLCGI